MQLFFDPLGQTPDFSLRIDRERLRLKKFQSLNPFFFDRLESLQNFRACPEGLSCRSREGTVLDMVSRKRGRSRITLAR